MTSKCGSYIRTGMDGKPLQPVTIDWEKGETGLIINNETRVALIKLIGSIAQVESIARGLSNDEHELLVSLYHMVQT